MSEIKDETGKNFFGKAWRWRGIPVFAALVLAIGGSIAVADAAAQAFPSSAENGKGRDGTQREGRSAKDVKKQNSRDKHGLAERPPRLSPEERQQLRQDIKDAGREIYLPRRAE